MKVVFIAQEQLLHPWFDDVVSACAARGHEMLLFDRTKDLDAQMQGAQVVVDHGGGRGTPQLFDAAQRAGVKLWQVHGTGYDHVDIPGIKSRGMWVAHTPGLFSAIALAEHAMYLMLHFAKRHDASQRSLCERVICLPMNDELHDKTLGIYGFGASGRELARRAAAFGMRIMAVDLNAVPAEAAKEYGLAFSGSAADLPKLLREADYISIHVPLNDSTRHALNRETLALMKPNAVIVNVSRGAIIEEEAVLEALRAGKLRGLGQDTCWREPVDPNEPLLQLNNAFVTPHVAGVTCETSRRRGEAIAGNVDRVAQGLEPLYQLPPGTGPTR